MMDVTKIFASDDVASFERFASEHPSIATVKARTTGGQLATLVWLAALKDAKRIVKYLLGIGADPREEFYGTNSLDIAVASGSFAAADVLIAAGVPVTGKVLAWLLRRPETDVPADPAVSALGAYLRELPSSHAWVDVTATARAIRQSSSFATIYSSHVDAERHVERIVSLVGTRHPGLEPGVTSQALDRIALEAAACLSAAHLLAGLYANEITEIITSEFLGYENQRKWLEAGKSRAIARVAKLAARHTGTYEDDDGARTPAAFVVTYFPVRAVVQAAQQNGVPKRDLSGRSFEAECDSILRDAGFAVRRTAATGDQGADLVAESAGLRFAIQCKDHAVPVGNAAVQEVIAATRYYSCDFGVVVAVNGFTKAAHELARAGDVLLIHKDALGQLTALATTLI